MVDSATNMLLETLRDLLVEEVKFLSGVSDEVKKAEADLRTIHALLMEADQIRGQCDSPTFRNCINELKELAYKAENVLETYAMEHQPKNLKKKLQRLMGILCACYSIHEVGNEINDIRSCLTDVTARLSSISGGGEAGSSNSAHKEQMRGLRLRYAHEVEQHFVGMEKDIQFVVSMVKDDSLHSPSIISICGMGGLGKTTLARTIYHHQDIQGKFDGRAWVCVTQQFQAETILKEIFEKIDGKKPDMGLPALVEGLYNVLINKKCLIVIDDIWESFHWNILKPAFPRKNCKVVLTTRNENIAHEEGCVHKLGFLSEDEGWDLLGKIAFPINDYATSVFESRSRLFEDIGKQMVRKCGCLPLAITVIGGILKHKQQTLPEWENINGNMDSYLRHGGEGIGNDERVKLVLDLSFDALPYYLKPCFLYLACFPEDANIDTDKLYRLWSAENLLSSEEKGNNETLRDVAERYLIELSFRCMVQLESGYFNIANKKFKSCRLHDLMRDLCSSKAEEVKFMKHVRISKNQEDIHATGDFTHILAFNIEDEARLTKISMGEVKDLRSILFLRKYGEFRIRSMDFQSIVNFENSKHLKVLVFENLIFEGKNLLSALGKQIYLKYLSLYNCKVQELPQHICNQLNLQTLDLRVSGKLILPNLIWKLKRLRNLFLPYEMEVIGGDRIKLDGLNELETLGRVTSESVCIVDIINLTNLRSVKVEIEEDTDSLLKIVDYMRSTGCRLHETTLRVSSCDLKDVIDKMLMIHLLVSLEIENCKAECSFPSYNQGMCPNISRLDIICSKITGNVMDVLGKLPNLQVLWLMGEFQEELETEIRFGVNSFPELKVLGLSDQENLCKWEVEKGAMPKLKSLYINGCSHLEKLPDGLKSISTLETLDCFNMSEEFHSRLREGVDGEGGGEDYANFSHIPNIIIS